jgi:hypothetical protein
MTQKNNTILTTYNKELSIQLSLNGLSFCILNSQTHTITTIKHVLFSKKETPVNLLDTLKHTFNTESVLQSNFDKVTVIHENELATLVPKALFNPETLADYLKLNAKILKTDFITFDEITVNDSANVYIPYVNLNNFIYDTFGSFTYKHFSTILIEQILTHEKHSNTEKMYIHVTKTHFECIAVNSGKLLLYNTFEYSTAEDFIYYILFTIEQLKLNPETINLIVLGTISEEDPIYKITYKYIRNIAFGKRFDNYKYTEAPATAYSDFILIQSL